MIEVIQWGEIPEDKVYKTHCDHCATQFRFKLKDGERTRDHCNSTVIKVICPLCTRPVYVPE